ncbi:hypothetical protein ACFP2F_12470 [Hymenobacter artigasi]|uniref:Uncharacterized protein n=1 Tax=Hymenobacter artigasi TaxID=2719616 RepID=A0ABX1HEG3_9BACT|nr:hypothetical protein [Hymenobacter artigasi]NKI88270.1 hypothetical protein [Hymenobacter artigasi]
MTTFFPSPTSSSSSSALVRTLMVWLLSNLGGTSVLALDFSIESPADLTIPLLVGFMAALISLAYVPLAWPFFALAQRICTGWRCQLLAVAGVVTVFGVANYLLLQWLPIGSFGTLLTFSRPYLGAALLAVAWLYRPQSAGQPATAKLSRPAPLLNSWCIRTPRRRPLLAK